MVYELVSKALKALELEPKPRPDNVFWISELSMCLRKAYFDRVSPKPVPFYSRFVMEMGKTLHKILLSAFKTLDYDVDVEVPVEAEIDGIKVHGRADVVVNNTIVIEVKTVEEVHGSELPRADHARQVKFYAALLNAVEAYLVYISRKDGRYTIVNVPFSREMTMEILRRRVNILKKALEEKKPPEPERGPWCRWCPYQVLGRC